MSRLQKRASITARRITFAACTAKAALTATRQNMQKRDLYAKA